MLETVIVGETMRWGCVSDLEDNVVAVVRATNVEFAVARDNMVRTFV